MKTKVILLIISIILVITGIFGIITGIKFNNNAVEIESEVSKVEETYRYDEEDNKITTYKVYTEYEVNSKKYNYRFDTEKTGDWRTSPYKKGDKIKIYYDKTKPETAFRSKGEFSFFGVAMIVIGVIFFIAAIKF